MLMDSTAYSRRRRATRTGWLDDSIQNTLLCSSLHPEGLALLDISELGARVRIDALAKRPELLSKHSATLVLGEGFKCPVRIKIAYLGADMAGLEFVDQPRQFHHLIRAYFRHELLGANLRPLRSAGRNDILRFSDDGPNWLEIGLQAAELNLFSADLTTLGHHIRWSTELPRISVNRPQRGTDSRVEPDLLPRELIRVIRNIPDLDEKLKAKLEAIILASFKND
jgi:hypothetical protein